MIEVSCRMWLTKLRSRAQQLLRVVPEVAIRVGIFIQIEKEMRANHSVANLIPV
jgi:hypothetical protein